MCAMHRRVIEQGRWWLLAWQDLAHDLGIALEQGIDRLGQLASYPPNDPGFAYVRLFAYLE
jgi:hypothetical protein